MELLTLDGAFQPQRHFENYQSLIWSERYSKTGEFQLTSNEIAKTMQFLPTKSYVTLRDSTVPMQVETHKIEKKKNSAPIITVSGRVFDACALGQRVSVNTLPTMSLRSAWMIDASKASDAAYKALRVVLGDKERLQGETSVLSATPPAISPNDAIPEIDLVLPADYSSLVPYTYEIKAGELYATILELLNTNNRGIKSVRPGTAGTQVGIEIYNGADLTNSIVIDARFDQIDDATYLLSEMGSANVGYVYGANGSQQVLKTSAPEPSGLDRRVLLVDVTGDNTTNTSTIRENRGLIELYKYNATALFDGEVAQQIALGYNNTYFLGDILKLTGEYGLSQNVRVAEFIRSSDDSGEKAYPTFEAIS